MDQVPERVWNLVIRTSEQGGVLSHYQLPVSFAEVLQKKKTRRNHLNTAQHSGERRKAEVRFYRTASDHPLRLLHQPVSVRVPLQLRREKKKARSAFAASRLNDSPADECGTSCTSSLNRSKALRAEDRCVRSG